MNKSSQENIKNENQNIFFIMLFVSTAIVSFVLYIMNVEYLTDSERLVWITVQVITICRPWFIVKNIEYE